MYTKLLMYVKTLGFKFVLNLGEHNLKPFVNTSVT